MVVVAAADALELELLLDDELAEGEVLARAPLLALAVEAFVEVAVAAAEELLIATPSLAPKPIRALS